MSDREWLSFNEAVQLLNDHDPGIFERPDSWLPPLVRHADEKNIAVHFRKLIVEEPDDRNLNYLREVIADQDHIDRFLRVLRKLTQGELHPAEGAFTYFEPTTGSFTYEGRVRVSTNEGDQDRISCRYRVAGMRFSLADIIALYSITPVSDAGGQDKAPTAATGAGEKACRDWLQEAFKADPNRTRRKRSFQDEALERFSGQLSVRGFNRAWDAVAPDAGRNVPGSPRAGNHST